MDVFFFKPAVVRALCFGLVAVVAGCTGGSRHGAIPSAPAAGAKSGAGSDTALWRSATIVAGRPFAELRAKKPTVATKKGTRRPLTAFNDGTRDECFNWSTAQCIVQGVPSGMGSLSIDCNGNSACLASTYSEYVVSAPSGVTVTFDPTAYTPPARSNVTITLDPSVTPGPINVTFGSTLVSGSGALPTNVTVPFQVLCSISAATCPQIQIVDEFMDGSPVVSGSPPPVQQTVVGKKAKFVASQVSGTGSGSYGPLTNVWWIIPGWYYKDYTRSGPAPTSMTAADLSSATPPPFYWTDNSRQHVYVQALLIRSDNQEIADFLTDVDYNVNRPDTSVSVTSVGPSAVKVGSRSDYALGTYLTFGDQASPSMSFSYSVTDDKKFPGMIGMTQLIYARYSLTGPRNVSSGAAYGSSSAPFLDNAVDYIAPVPSSATFAAIDAPGFGVPEGNTFDAMSASGEFTDYFMYQATGANTVWVTLNMATWAWSGSATLDPTTNSWCLNGAPGCPNTAPAATGGVTGGPWGNMTQPAWPGIYHNTAGQGKDRRALSHPANGLGPITPVLRT